MKSFCLDFLLSEFISFSYKSLLEKEKEEEKKKKKKKKREKKKKTKLHVVIKARNDLEMGSLQEGIHFLSVSAVLCAFNGTFGIMGRWLFSREPSKKMIYNVCTQLFCCCYIFICEGECGGGGGGGGGG